LKLQSRLTNQATGRKYYDLVLTLNRANTSGGHVALLYQDAQAAIRRVGISTVSLIQLVDENEIDGGMSGGCSETELSIQMIGPEVKQIRLESQSLSEPALLDVPAKPID
jgi:hypothetical protein